MKQLFWILYLFVLPLHAIDSLNFGFVGGFNYSKLRWDKSVESYKLFSRTPRSDFKKSWQMGIQGEYHFTQNLSALLEVNYKNIKLNFYELDYIETTADGPSYGNDNLDFFTQSLLGKLDMYKFFPHIIFGIENMYLLANHRIICRGGMCTAHSNEFQMINRYILGFICGIGKDFDLQIQNHS